MTDRKNILLLMTDQHRVDTLGCYGNRICETPALDGLADRGIRFDNAFTPTAICTPARATLLTGVLPFRHTLLANYERNVGYREELDGRFRPFSAELADAGYQLGHVGKWHIGKERGPDQYGFDGVHYPGWGNPVNHADYRQWLAQRGLPEFELETQVRGTFPNGEPGNLLAGVLNAPVEATFEYYLADRTIEKLRQYAADGRPFYLACDWFGPHLPYCIPADYYHRYDPAQVELPASIAETFAAKPRVQRSYSEHWTFDSIGLDGWRELTAAYWGYVTLIDEQVGRILAAVEELGLTDDTVVAFTADHGEFTGSHRLHDKGPAMYDDIYRIPFIVAGPGVRRGHSESRFVTLTDLTPTFCELAGVARPGHYDGHSLLPLFRDDPELEWPDEVVAEFHGHHFPYPQRMIRTSTHKLVINPADRNELYDLIQDPDELQNRYDHPEMTAVRQELSRRLYEILRGRGDNFYHWMSSMNEVGGKNYDVALSQLDSAPGGPVVNGPTATITIDDSHEIGRIDPLIYGHFLESNFFGNIEGGILDEGSPRSNSDGLRRDVIDICRRLGVPIVRWPGGNFTSAYHWEDGIGPRAARPRRLDLTWGGAESNRFGTDEFLAWCAEIGAEPYLVHSCRNVDEAVRWVEYTNYGGDTFYTRARAANGHPAPYKVRYWGVGNEVYGPWQMGHRTPDQYAADAREHAQFMRLVDPDLTLIGVGEPREEWMRPLLTRAGNLLDYVSLHLYGASTHLAGDDEYDAVVAQSLYFEREIARFADLVESIAGEVGVDRPLSIALDEWNIRHLEPAAWPEPRPGADGGTAERDVPWQSSADLRVNRWSPRTLADALFYAGVFHGLHRLCGMPVAPRMANTVNLINANSLIAVRPHGVLASASYHVWDLYQNHLGRISVPVTVAGPSRRGPIRQGAERRNGAFAVRNGTIPYVDAIATRDDGRSVQLVVINRHPTDAIDGRLALAGGELPHRAEVLSIGADTDDLYAANGFSDPERVALSDSGTVELDDERYSFPPHSITLLRFVGW